MDLIDFFLVNKIKHHDPMFELKYGISDGVLDAPWGTIIHGVRCKPENGTSGWYIWVGEHGTEEEVDFYKPYCGHHLDEAQPHLVDYLDLPPGWCFATNGEEFDIWENPELLSDDYNGGK